MKKNYIAPSVKAHNVKLTSIIAASANIGGLPSDFNDTTAPGEAGGDAEVREDAWSWD